jgi:hypothetical protein
MFYFFVSKELYNTVCASKVKYTTTTTTIEEEKKTREEHDFVNIHIQSKIYQLDFLFSFSPII